MHIQVGHKRESLCPPTARTTAANMKRKDAMERWESKGWRQSKAETPKDHDFWMFCQLSFWVKVQNKDHLEVS